MSQIDRDFEPYETENSTDGINFKWDLSLLSNESYCQDQCLGIRIRNQTAYIIFSRRSWQTRHDNTLELIKNVLKSHNIPDMDFVIYSGDIPPDHPYPWLTYNKKLRQNAILIPDFTFIRRSEAKLDDWVDLLQRLRNTSINHPFEDRHETALWRGHPVSKSFIGYHRELLVQISNKYPKEVDAKYVTFVGENQDLKHYIAAEDFCKSKFLIHTNGVSYSSRLKNIMACGSVIFVPQAPWIEYWYHLLENEKNVIFVASDFKDLLFKLQNMKENPSQAERIGNGAGKLVSDHLNMDAALCYWAAVLRRFKTPFCPFAAFFFFFCYF